MSGVTFTVILDDAQIMGALDRLQAVGDDPGLLRILGDYGRDSTRRRFIAQTGPDGSPWKGLSEAYAAIKPSGYGILYLSGALEGSVTYRSGASSVSWGSPMVYAAVHQFGATIVPKNAKALSFVLGDTFAAGNSGAMGTRQAFLVQVQSVTIPARPYLGISTEDREEIPQLAGEYLMRRFEGA